jgi:1,4-dihydroxy-2-naphthoyl-CoA hydrolase
LYTLEQLNARLAGSWSGVLGMTFTAIGDKSLSGRLPLRIDHMASNGYLHAGALITFADTICGFGCITFLPEGGLNFTTVELKSNFLGTAHEGVLLCDGVMQHGGRTTQVWDATVRNEATGKTLALFRCTQMILYPR